MATDYGAPGRSIRQGSARSRLRVAAFLLLLRLCFPPAPALADPGAAAAPRESSYFSFALDETGTPRYTQHLFWEAVDHVLRYRVEIAPAGGEVFLDTYVETPSLEVHLAPGDYRYRITLYNLLGRADLQTSWRALTVLRARQPRIDEVSPSRLFLDQGQSRILLRGEDLEENILVTMENDQGRIIVLEEQDRRILEDGTSSAAGEEITLTLPVGTISPGEYRIVVENPGGLLQSLPFPVGYQKPLDFALSLGWTPVIPLLDSWFTDLWDDGIYPVALTLQGDLYFVKGRRSFLGLGFHCSAASLGGGQDDADLQATILVAGLHGSWRYRLGPRLALVGRLGPGLAYTTMDFDYRKAGEGPSMETVDPALFGGAFLSFGVSRNIRLQAGVQLQAVFYESQTAGFVSPGIHGGLYF
ncbi:hypothetical protein [Alkalispirochaeta alkalica]|uniref:hypothetical protein n=1 Tax=Alkalispirochaeta alkalica TaxID=46356 RepID=UPI00037F0569|nr:hypothetical protein [Alkalispirochaeta alkalica]